MSIQISGDLEHFKSSEDLMDIHDSEKALWSPLFSSKLPACYIGGRIPINGAKQRIDIYIRAPTAKEIAIYEARAEVQRNLCVDYFLRNECEKANCESYHGTLNPETYQVLQHRTLGMACRKGSLCRIANCPYGHICQRGECGRAGKWLDDCRLPGSMHGLDTKVTEWVAPDEHRSGPKVSSQDTMASLPDTSSARGVAISAHEDFLM